MNIIQSKVTVSLSGGELENLYHNCKAIKELKIFRVTATSANLQDLENFVNGFLFLSPRRSQMSVCLKEVELEFSLEFIYKAMTQFFTIENYDSFNAILALSNTVFPRLG